MEVSESVEKGYLNVGEVSRYLGVKRSTIYQWAKEGKIPHYELHKMKRFKKEEIDAWMESQRGNGTGIDKRGKRVLEIGMGARRSPKPDVDGVVRKAVEEARRNNYNEGNGNQTKIKGLRKEVTNGNL